MESLAKGSYGKYLKKIRIEKGLSIENICFETKISRFIIEQIEFENRDELPEDVFLKGFLKSYAEVLGLDPVKVVKLYMGTGDELVEEADDIVEKPEKSNLNRYVIGGVIAGIAVVCLALYFFIAPIGADDAVVENIPVVAAPEEPVETSDAPEAATAEKNMVLDVVCIEETVLKVSTDGNMPVEYALKPEERIQIKARDNYNVLIDNNCGVTLFMGDKPVDVPGKCGQVVNLRLP